MLRKQKTQLLNGLLIGLFLFIPVILNSGTGNNKHFLWEVKSGKATVYLLGSIHVAKDSIYPLPEPIDQCYKKSDYLVVEFNMNDIDPFAIMKKAFYQDTNTLKGNVKPEIYKELQERFTKLGMGEAGYAKMKPWMAVMTVTQLQLMKGGFQSDAGIDMHYMTEAKNDNKEILQLETAEQQINLLNDELGSMQNEFVEYSLKDMDSMSGNMDDMLDIWMRGDVKALEKLVIDDTKDMPESERFLDEFLNRRNDGMLKKIKEYLKTDKTYFVIVGSAHLIGDKGIVKMLENEKMYGVEQK